MRYFILILLLFISFPVSADQNVTASASVGQDKQVLIRDIRMEGFVLGDKSQFLKLFKPYRNKHLNADDMDAILKEIQIIYEREGYKELVSITYKVTKHRLVFTALMTS